MKKLNIGILIFLLVAFTAATHNDVETFLQSISIKRESNGAALNIKQNTVTTLTDGGASTESIVGLIPAKAVCLQVSCVVDVVLAGSGLTTWSLGDGTDADLYGTSLAKTAGETVSSADYTASPMTQAWSASAGNLTMTAAAGQFDSGQITCTCFYLDSTAPSI